MIHDAFVLLIGAVIGATGFWFVRRTTRQAAAGQSVETVIGTFELTFGSTELGQGVLIKCPRDFNQLDELMKLYAAYANHLGMAGAVDIAGDTLTITSHRRLSLGTVAEALQFAVDDLADADATEN